MDWEILNWILNMLFMSGFENEPSTPSGNSGKFCRPYTSGCCTMVNVQRVVFRAPCSSRLRITG
jgi:hypothetical protein